MPKREPLYPHVLKGKASRQKVGYSVPRVVRDRLLVHELHIPYEEAVRLSELLDQQLKEADWLELYDGTTFEKTFVPKGSPQTMRDIRAGDLVKSRVWMEGNSYPWLTVLGGPYRTSWAGQPVNEYKVTNGLTENNIFEDTIFDHIAKHH